VDLLRGRPVEEALTSLRLTPKAAARDILKALESAVANARVKKPDVDVDRLFVKTAFVDGGPSLKRIRPAPMGRAFRVQKRMCHVTLGLGETPYQRPMAARRHEEAAAPAASASAAHPKAPAKKTAGTAKKAAVKKGGAKAKTAKKGKA
ncbi:MAG TPA: 50S ribosomal protein L22, partial [Candidatus Polarisedimenticolia bacterium]|nr:50S ribosomal protein L22 [Candidatus Polarisedimenticolia bacterium]